MSDIWSAPDAEPLDWFGPPPSGALPTGSSFDPHLSERFRIRELDLKFCRDYYARYLVQQKKRVKGQQDLF